MVDRYRHSDWHLTTMPRWSCRWSTTGVWLCAQLWIMSAASAGRAASKLDHDWKRGRLDVGRHRLNIAPPTRSGLPAIPSTWREPDRAVSRGTIMPTGSLPRDCPLTRCNSPCGGRRDGRLSPDETAARLRSSAILETCPPGEDTSLRVEQGQLDAPVGASMRSKVSARVS